MDLCRTVIFPLIIQLTLGFKNKEVFMEKQMRSDVDMTPLCTNGITSVHCMIPKKNNGSAVCVLRYARQRNTENECGSKLKLMFQNQTVFLHLMDLTPEDSGMYYCQCTTEEGIKTLHLNVTVEEVAPESDRSKTTDDKNFVVLTYSSVSAVIVIFGVIVAVIYKRRCCRQQLKVKDEEDPDPYAALQEPNNDLYQTIFNVNPSSGSGSRHQCSLREREYEKINYNTN